MDPTDTLAEGYSVACFQISYYFCCYGLPNVITSGKSTLKKKEQANGKCHTAEWHLPTEARRGLAKKSVSSSTAVGVREWLGPPGPSAA